MDVGTLCDLLDLKPKDLANARWRQERRIRLAELLSKRTFQDCIAHGHLPYARNTH